MLNLMLAIAPPTDPNGVELKLGLTPGMIQTLIVLGVILLVVVVVFAWVAMRNSPGHSSKRRHRHHRHHHHHGQHPHEAGTEAAVAPGGTEPEEEFEEEPRMDGKPRRRIRRRHRPRNPTLAQTGGLPPKRPELSAPAAVPPGAPPPQA